MPVQIIYIGGLIITSLSVGLVYTKANKKSGKIEIMSVRSELRKIDKLNKNNKEALW